MGTKTTTVAPRRRIAEDKKDEVAKSKCLASMVAAMGKDVSGCVKDVAQVKDFNTPAVMAILKFLQAGGGGGGGGGKDGEGKSDDLGDFTFGETSCSAYTHLKKDSGIFDIHFARAGKVKMYCETGKGGGAWMLLVTQKDPRSDHSGAVSPFGANKNTDQPTFNNIYSRNYNALFTPKHGDEFMVVKHDSREKTIVSDDFRTFRTECFSQWAGKKKCYGGGQNSVGDNHGQIAYGQTYRPDGKPEVGYLYFNGCAYDGGCASTGSDAYGFSKNENYSCGGCGGKGAYGAGWDGKGAGANFYWGAAVQSAKTFNMLYFWRPAEWTHKKVDFTPGKESCGDLPKEYPSGVYDGIKIGGKAVGGGVFCQQKYNGGGWHLIATSTNGKTQYGGAVSMFVHNLNPEDPSMYHAYSRNWKTHGLKAKANDQFMIVKVDLQNPDADFAWATFKVATWCDWDTSTCAGAKDHTTFAKGQTYNQSGQAVSGYVWFNSCSRHGGCNSKGADTAGFGKNINYSHGPSGVYGSGWDGDAYFYWGNNSRLDQNRYNFSYFYKPF